MAQGAKHTAEQIVNPPQQVEVGMSASQYGHSGYRRLTVQLRRAGGQGPGRPDLAS